MSAADVACTGGHMAYCEVCKHQRRWEVVGELPAVERAIEYPGVVVIHPTVCMLTKGARFVNDAVIQ